MGTSRTVVHYASGDNRDYEFEWSKAVLEYLEKGYPAEEKNCELEVGSTTYKVLKRDTVTAFYDADGNTLFDVTNDRLKEEYEAMESLDETEPKSEIGRAIAGIEKQAFDEAVYMGKTSLADIVTGNVPDPTPEEVQKAMEEQAGAEEAEGDEPGDDSCGQDIEETHDTETQEASENGGEEEKTDPEPTAKGIDGAVAKLQGELKKAMITGSICKKRIEETMHEYSRCFCTFFGEKLMKESYEWGVYHQKGNSRWIPDEGNIACMECILYPGNLPEAWEHTPMKYSALEILAQNIPTTAFRYEDAIDVYLKFPKLEWFCKMGLNQLAKDVVRGYNYSGNMTGKVNYKAGTIYEILGLNKVNTRTLQAIDGNHYELRLLQVAQQLDIQMKPEQLKEFYETFECNTDLLKEKNRKVSLHKLCWYIDKESERYPIGEKNACMWGYSYNRYKERTDPRIERKQNMAHDWLEYIGWCRELKYDLDNKFIYMPNNFKKVHDRVAEEYKALQDKKAAAEKLRREKLAAKRMEQTKKAMEEIFSKNDGVDAFQIKGNGLILVVPQSGDEIRKEGEALDHCVGGYVERVAKGETNIFFVRKADHPEQSYFTMEWKNNKVVQCRGKSNCGMPPDVKAFVQVFEKKMQDAIQKGDTNGKKKQNLQSA